MEHLLDFISDGYFIVGYGITLVISLIYYKKYFNTVLKHFPILIAYTFLNEILGYLVRNTEYFSIAVQSEYTSSNSILYNIFDLFFFGYFFYVYWKLIKSKRTKNWIVIGALFVFLANIINALFYDPIHFALYHANAFSCFALILIAIQYLKQLRPYLKWKIQRYNLMFWISIGLIIFHLIFPFLFVTAYENPSIWYTYNFRTALRILIVIMYTLFSIGFIVSRRKSFV